MPKRQQRRRRRQVRLDKVTYPLFYNIGAGHGASTTCQTMASTFDRTRAFRISAIHGTFSALNVPCFVQFHVFAPTSSADNTWASPVLEVPVGPLRRFRYRIPASANLWYPSDVALNTVLLQCFNICISKELSTGIAFGNCYATVLLRPEEPSVSCPKLNVQPSTSFGVDNDGDSIAVISDSDDEYFST